MFFFFKQKTAYELTHSDWSSAVCSSDLMPGPSRQRRDVLPVPGDDGPARLEIGRASCRERVLCVVEISVVAVSLKKKAGQNRSSALPDPIFHPRLRRHRTISLA